MIADAAAEVVVAVCVPTPTEPELPDEPPVDDEKCDVCETCEAWETCEKWPPTPPPPDELE